MQEFTETKKNQIYGRYDFKKWLFLLLLRVWFYDKNISHRCPIKFQIIDAQYVENKTIFIEFFWIPIFVFFFFLFNWKIFCLRIRYSEQVECYFPGLFLACNNRQILLYNRIPQLLRFVRKLRNIQLLSRGASKEIVLVWMKNARVPLARPYPSRR